MKVCEEIISGKEEINEAILLVKDSSISNNFKQNDAENEVNKIERSNLTISAFLESEGFLIDKNTSVMQFYSKQNFIINKNKQDGQ